MTSKMRVEVNGKALPTWQAGLMMVGAFVVMLALVALILPFVAFVLTVILALVLTVGLAGGVMRLINGRWPGWIVVKMDRKR